MHEIKLSTVNEVLKQFDIKIVIDKTAPAPEPEPNPESDIIYCAYGDIIHHYNPESLKDVNHPNGRGVSIIFCVGDKYEWVKFNDQEFHCLNRNDEGREWWSNIDYQKQRPVHMYGIVLAKKKGGKVYRFTIPDRGKDFEDYKGKCFGRKK